MALFPTPQAIPWPHEYATVAVELFEDATAADDAQGIAGRGPTSRGRRLLLRGFFGADCRDGGERPESKAIERRYYFSPNQFEAEHAPAHAA